MASDQDKPLSSYPLLALSPDIPSDADALSARTQIRIAEAEIHRLDVELSIILARRARTFSRIDRCRAVIAPYKKLPAELVRKVLVLCVPRGTGESTSSPVQANETRFRLQVTQICSTWRRIAFDESALWNLSLYPFDKSVELAMEWFRQCSAFQLGLIIDNSFKGPHLRLVAPKIITPYSKRLVSLSLPVDKVMLKYISPQPFVNLEKLSLDLNLENIYPWAESDLQSGMSLPSLRSLKVALPSGMFDDRLLLRLPLSQLINLELIGNMSCTHPIRVLSECISLERCAMWGIRVPYNSPAPLPDTIILLPHLSYLKIDSISDSIPILFSLGTPNLCSLVTTVEMTSPGCHSFFRRLSRLHSIIVDGTASYGQEFIDENFLACIPASVEVTLQGYLLQQSTLNKIAVGELLPNVEHLTMPTDNLHSIRNMLMTRNQNARNSPDNITFIKKATIFSNIRQRSFGNVLADLRSNGIDITLGFRPLPFALS